MPGTVTVPHPLLHGIQTLRGMFAVLVVCHHIGVHSSRHWEHEWLGGIFNTSTFRVDFFFVLSGFVLWTAHRSDAGRPAAMSHFLRRRFWRLYPLLIVLSLYKVLLICIVPGRDISFGQVICSLFALPQSSFPLIVSAWTLSFEMYFMVVLALCLALPRQRVLHALLALTVLFAMTGVLLDIRPAISGAGFFTHPFVLEFAAGVLVAEWIGLRRSRPWGMLCCGGALLGLILGVLQHAWLTDQPVIWQKLFWAAVFSLGIGGLVLWERACAPERWWLRDHWYLGRASYSIFLSHGLVLMAVFDRLDPQLLNSDPLWIDLFFILLFAVAVLFGLAVYRWLELPLNRWCKSVSGITPGMSRVTPSQTY